MSAERFRSLSVIPDNTQFVVATHSCGGALLSYAISGSPTYELMNFKFLTIVCQFKAQQVPDLQVSETSAL